MNGCGLEVQDPYDVNSFLFKPVSIKFDTQDFGKNHCLKRFISLAGHLGANKKQKYPKSGSQVKH